MSSPSTSTDAALRRACRLDGRTLAVFVAVAEELHFGRAAQRLYLDPSLPGKLIRQLERAGGRKLFERSTRSVALTDAGRGLLPEAQRAVAALNAVELALRATGEDPRPQVIHLDGSAVSR